MEFIENEVKEVGPGVWVRVAIDNISWCDLGSSAAVIDALEDAGQADVVRGLIKETTGQELKWIVNTHWDVDHIACNHNGVKKAQCSSRMNRAPKAPATGTDARIFTTPKRLRYKAKATRKSKWSGSAARILPGIAFSIFRTREYSTSPISLVGASFHAARQRKKSRV